MTQQQSDNTRRIVVLLQGPGVSFIELDTSLAHIEEVSHAVFADLTDDGAMDVAAGGTGIRNGEMRARAHLFHQDGNGGFVFHALSLCESLSLSVAQPATQARGWRPRAAAPIGRMRGHRAALSRPAATASERRRTAPAPR